MPGECENVRDQQPPSSRPPQNQAMITLPNPHFSKITTPEALLRHYRLHAGYKSAREFATKNGVNTTTYQQHERGRRPLTFHAAKRYEELLNLPRGTLLDQSQLQSPVRIPIVGRLSASGSNVPVVAENEPQFAFLPDANEFMAHIVVDDSMHPIYRCGDNLFHRALSSDPLDLMALHGAECIVQLRSGEKLIRMLTFQPNGLATLFSLLPSQPPLYDQEVMAAAVIEHVQRAVHRTMDTQRGEMTHILTQRLKLSV